MFEMISGWFSRRFSDPHAITLFLLLIFGFVAIYVSGLFMAPLLVALVLSYLAEWPVQQLSRLGMGRTWAASLMLLMFMGVMLLCLLVLVPTLWKQASALISELPQMVDKSQDWVLTLPQRYPDLVQPQQVTMLVDEIQKHMVEWAQDAVGVTVTSLGNVVALLIYLVLVPLLMFFFLKDKDQLLHSFDRFLPDNRKLAIQVWAEMNQQIANYVRGKVLEIVIVGTASYIAFALMGLRYSALLALLVGLSVLIPYIGAAVVTLPVALVALFQWGTGSEFWYLMLAYGIIQTLDGNVLVPLLFSEAVNLHPVAIILAVLFFGGLWGFWGVFFAIPLATLVKAVINAWPRSQPESPDAEAKAEA